MSNPRDHVTNVTEVLGDSAVQYPSHCTFSSLQNIIIVLIYRVVFVLSSTCKPH